MKVTLDEKLKAASTPAAEFAELADVASPEQLLSVIASSGLPILGGRVQFGHPWANFEVTMDFDADAISVVQVPTLFETMAL